MIELDLIHTLAFGGVVLFAGYAIRRAVPVLGRYNLPAPVIGGLVVSLAALVARQWDVTLFRFDTTLRDPLMIAFFTTIGFGASVGLLKKGGPLVLLFFALSTIAAVLQNVVGAATAHMFDQPPLFGVLCGSVTLTGGPATGLAFADQFEAAGVSGAAAIAVAAAMFGIVMGGVVGAPVGTLLIERLNRTRMVGVVPPTTTAAEVVEAELPGPQEEVLVGEDVSAFVLLKSVGMILVAMWAGTWVGVGITALGATLPPYIGAMLFAAVLRNLDDATGWLGLSQQSIDDVGNVALSFFLVLAMMTLELWKIGAVAVPLVIILLVQVLLVTAYCYWPIFAMMGRDYDAAVMAGGFIGFMMGTTANAMANMDSLVRRYGASPRAFLVVPMVGAFFIDFVNSLIIQGCLNLFA